MRQEIKATAIWLLLAVFLTSAGFWQIKVAVARDSRSLHRELPLPSETKRTIRPPQAEFTGDVVADYVARCEKGMTDQDILWILDDFHNAGLDLDWRDPAVTIEEVLDNRKALNRWYHDALVDGLRLSPEQSTQASRTLDELFEKEMQWFLEQRKSRSEPFNDWLGNTNPNLVYPDAREIIADLSGAMVSFSDIPEATPYYPWKLCQLTPEQEKLTWKQLFLIFEGTNHEIESEDAPGLVGGSLFRREDFHRGYPIDELLVTQDDLPSLIFPLLTQQKLIAKNNPNSPFSDPSDPPGLSTLENVRLLHPCQLKALLLFNPRLPPILQSQLEQQSR